MRSAQVAAVFLGVVAPVALVAACGARSGLFLDGYVTSESNDGAVSADAPSDVIPGLDANVRDVAPLAICADASDTLVYTVTESNTLVKFNPSSAQFTPIGALNCPDPFGRAPFSMAVDRQGNAYVLYYAPAGQGPGSSAPPGSIFKVDLNSAACAPTSFVPGQDGFLGFGMGFVANDVGTGETLYVADSDSTPGRLGAIDETTLSLSVIGTFPTDVQQAELTGTGDGRLFAFYNQVGNSQVGGSVIGQIDKKTGAVIGEALLPQVTQGNGWAFAFWGGNFYTFTAPGPAAGTVVQRYNPVDGTVVTVATYPEVIDGAGVSTCAPVQ
jgi:hypothetical protein